MENLHSPGQKGAVKPTDSSPVVNVVAQFLELIQQSQSQSAIKGLVLTGQGHPEVLVSAIGRGDTNAGLRPIGLGGLESVREVDILARKGQRRIGGTGSFSEGTLNLVDLRHRNSRHTTLEDTSLLGGNAAKRVTKLQAMVVADAGNGANLRLKDVC